MSTRHHRNLRTVATTLAAVLVAAATVLVAAATVLVGLPVAGAEGQPPLGGRPPAYHGAPPAPPPRAYAPSRPAPPRYDRSHYFPPRGHGYDRLPPDAYRVHYRTRPYYYHYGNWYHHDGARFIVVAPPVGIAVPFLPPYYSTFWVGGYPYYYANDVYYVWRPRASAYVVTEPPPVAETTATPPVSELFVYPAQGQSDVQQGSDRYECHVWASGETGFDPTRPGGGVDASTWAVKREDYQRALAACLTARGYSVR